MRVKIGESFMIPTHRIVKEGSMNYFSEKISDLRGYLICNAWVCYIRNKL